MSTSTYCEAEVSSSAVTSMFEVSGSTSVSREGAVLADPWQLTLRVEALSPGNLSTKLVSLASISSTFHKEVQIKRTHTVKIYVQIRMRDLERRACLDGMQKATLQFTQYPPRTFQGVFWPSCRVQSYSSTKRYSSLLIQERGWIPAAIPS